MRLIARLSAAGDTHKGHIPDLIRFGSTTTCWEFKCYTPFLPSGAKGNGSARCGGAASRADGHFIALGNTEEHLSVVVLGHPPNGVTRTRID